MTLKLHGHPLSSFCQKVLIAFYENDTPFEFVHVDLSDETSRAAFRALWPMARMPVLRDETRDATVFESTAVIEYLDAHYPGATRFVPAEPDEAWRTRMWDRFYDHYVMHPMQKVVADRFRPDGAHDPHGVDEARTVLRDAYAVIEREMAARAWAAGEHFGLADCAAAPALFYAGLVEPYRDGYPNLAAYFDRLHARPSYARAYEESKPYLDLFPRERDGAAGAVQGAAT